MDVSQAVRRIIRTHVLVLLSAVLVAVAVVVGMSRGDRAEYEAAARVSMPPESVRFAAEAEAVAARTRGLATSRRAVEGALEATGIDRAPEDLVERITVTALGTSTLAAITVRDTDGAVAARLADALAVQVVALYDRASRAELAAAIARADKQAAGLAARRRAAESAAASGDPVRVASAQQQQAALDRETEAVEALRRDLALVAAQRPAAELLDRAIVPVRPLPSSLPQDAVLAVAVALLLGVGVAAGLEAVRPTLVGSRAIATALQVPLLADLRRGIPGATPAQHALLAAELRIAARRHGVDHVLVLPAGGGREAGELARTLRQALVTEGPRAVRRTGSPRHSQTAVAAQPLESRSSAPSSVSLNDAALHSSRPVLSGVAQLTHVGGAPPPAQSQLAESLTLPSDLRVERAVPEQPAWAGHAHGGATPPPSSVDRTPPEPAAPGWDTTSSAPGAPSDLLVEAFDVAPLTAGGSGTGLVVLSPLTLRAKALDEVTDLVTATGWPVLGLVGLRTRGRVRGRVRGRA